MLSTNSSQSPGGPKALPPTADILRTRNKKRDESIRRKSQQFVSRQGQRKLSQSSPSLKRQASMDLNSVASLRPAAAHVIIHTALVIQAAQLMAAKRTDAVLVVDSEGELVGILTDKDIAYRVVAAGLDVRSTVISSVMTPDPMTVSCTGNRNEALNIMVTKKFRHLPVLLELPPQTIREEDAATLMPDSETGSDAMTSSTVVGLLDITKCVFDRLDELQNKATDDERILSAMELLEGRGMESGAQSLMSQVVAQIQGCPSVGSVLSTLYESEQGTNSTPNDSGLAIIGVPEAMMKTSVKEVAQIMKEYHHTAVIILSAGDSGDRVTGILTTKDIVLRVLAANLDPVTTSAVRVMTPHPDFVTKEDTILNCLQKLKTGRYLHLPVMDGSIPVGLVDVMTLTISMLTYLMSKDAVVPGQVETGPLWNHFWNATLPQQQHSQFDLMSGESEDGMTAGSIDYSSLMASPSAQQPRVTSVIPPQVVSTPMTNSTGTPSFAFKLWNTGSGQVFRLSLLENATFETLLVSVSEKTRLSISTTTLATDKRVRKTLREPVSGQDLCLGYFDEDGDAVLISTDEDLKEAIGMAHGCGWTRLEVFLGANLETMEVFRRDHKSRRLRFFGMNPTGSWTAATIGVLSLAAGMGLMMFVKHQQKVL